MPPRDFDRTSKPESRNTSSIARLSVSVGGLEAAESVSPPRSPRAARAGRWRGPCRESDRRPRRRLRRSPAPVAKYEPTAISRTSLPTWRSATSVTLRCWSAESHIRSTSTSGGSPAVKKRLRRDSGDSSWKKRRIASRSAGVERRTLATVPSRSTSRGAAASSTAGGAGATGCISGLGACHDGGGDGALTFGIPDGQHRARRASDDALGDTARQQV